MPEHVHEWAGDDQGAVCCGCDETLNNAEANRRLNATERLSAEDAGAIQSYIEDDTPRAHPISVVIHKALVAYASALEGENEKP